MVLYLQLIVKVELIQIDLNIVPINEKKVAHLKMNVLLIISEHVERANLLTNYILNIFHTRKWMPLHISLGRVENPCINTLKREGVCQILKYPNQNK